MFLDIVNKVVRVVTISMLAIITVLISTEVVLRYCFGSSLDFTEEFSRYTMVWMVFLGSSLAVRENSHNRVEIFVNLFPARTRAWLNLAAQLLFSFFLAFLVFQGCIALPYQFEQIIPTLNISMFWFYLALPVGGMLMFMNLVPLMWQNILIISGKMEPPEEKFEIPVIDGGLS